MEIYFLRYHFKLNAPMNNHNTQFNQCVFNDHPPLSSLITSFFPPSQNPKLTFSLNTYIFYLLAANAKLSQGLFFNIKLIYSIFQFWKVICTENDIRFVKQIELWFLFHVKCTQSKTGTSLNITGSQNRGNGNYYGHDQ